MTRLVCPACQKELRTSAAMAQGQSITCPACQATFALGASPSGAPAPTSRSGRRLSLFVGLGAGLAVLLLTAFVWPGFLRNDGLSPLALANQAEARNLLAFAPANSNFVAGIRVGHVRKQPELQNAWGKLRQMLAQFQSLPAEAHDLIADADMVLLAGIGGPAGSGVCVVSTEHPFDAAKVKKAVQAGPERRLHGITVCPCDDLVPDRTASLAFASDKVALLGLMPVEDLARHVAHAKEPKLAPDLKAQVDQVSGSVIWCAIQFDEETKQGLRKLNEQLAPLAFLVKEITTIGPIAARGKGAILTVDLAEPHKVKLTVGFTCQDAADGAELKAAVLNVWVNQGKILLGMLGQRFGKVVGEVSDTFDLEQRGNSVLLSVQVNQATLEELLNAAPLLTLPKW